MVNGGGGFTTFFSYSGRMEYHSRSCLCNVRPAYKTKAHTEYMKKFYAVPENQAQLRKCISRSKFELVALETKIKELEEFYATITKPLRSSL